MATTSTITIVAKDAFSNLISGAPVTASSTGTNNVFSPAASGSTDGAGSFTTTYSSTKAEAKTISATISGISITQNVGITVNPGPVGAGTSTVGAVPTTITTA